MEAVQQPNKVKPFWRNDCSESLSEKLWIPTGDDLKKNSTNTSKSWFKITSISNNKISEIAELQNFKSENSNAPSLVAKRIKMHLTKLQSRMIRNWMKSSDMFYNKAIDYLNECYEKSKIIKKYETISKYDLRDKLIEEFPDNDVPFDIKANAILDAYKALKSSIALAKLNKTPFELKPRNNANVIALPKSSFKNEKNIMFPKSFKELVKNSKSKALIKYKNEIEELATERKQINADLQKYKKAKKYVELKRQTLHKNKLLTEKEEKLKKKLDFSENLTIKFAESFTINNDYRICHYKGYGYYIIVPEIFKISNNIPKYDVVSLDPGVRTFQCYYSQEQCGEIGPATSNRILRILKHADRLNSELDGETKTSKRKGINKAIQRIHNKVKNLVNEMHWKSISFLTKRYKKIIIPKFCTKSMLEKDTLNSDTKRMLQQLSHYKFRERLIYKAIQHNSSVMVCTEEYTSKSCTKCGIINDNLGSNKSFRCSSCSLDIDRDVNGSRNILIKSLSSMNFKDSPASIETQTKPLAALDIAA